MLSVLARIVERRASVIAGVVEVRGDILSRNKGLLAVYGTVHGRIEHEGPVLVGQGAQVAKSVKAPSVVIEGEVHGDVDAEGKLVIRATGRLHGNATCQGLEVHPGATFAGTFRTKTATLLLPSQSVSSPFSPTSFRPTEPALGFGRTELKSTFGKAEALDILREPLAATVERQPVEETVELQVDSSGVAQLAPEEGSAVGDETDYGGLSFALKPELAGDAGSPKGPLFHGGFKFQE